MKTLKKIIFAILLLVIIGGGVGYAVYTQKFKAKKKDQDLALFTVEQGPLTISVVEAATIKARNVEIIKSEVQGKTTVLWVIDEGTEVKEGDVLIKLDASTLEDLRDKQEILVNSTKSTYDISIEALEVAKNKAESDVEQAELTLRFAGLDLKKYQEGEYPTNLKDLQEKIKIAEQEVTRTREKLDGSKNLLDENYISKTEYQSDEIAWHKARLDLTLQKSQLDLLENYTYTRTIEELKSNQKKAKMALERVQRKAKADIFEAQAKLQAAGDKYKREEKILNKVKDQISKTVIKAPNDGIIVYASSTKASWRSKDEPLSEGEIIREYQELFHLPKADLVNAVANIHEANLDKVKIGSEVTIEVDAIPGEIFTGKVGKIAPMPDARMVWINPNLKVYKTEIFINEKPGKAYKLLRTGMGCQIEVVQAHYENAVYVPIQTVITVSDQPTAYIYEDGKTKPVPVTIGEDNNRMVRVISGLKKGQKVLMTPPLSKAEVRNGKRNGKGTHGKPGMKRKPSGMDKPAGPGQKRKPGSDRGNGQGGSRRKQGRPKQTGNM